MSAERWFEEETGSTADAFSASARCSDGTGELVALFYSEQLDDIARAKGICSECPVRQSCFDEALVRREPYGVWGGQLFFKGKVLAMKRPRGRPPKNASLVPETPCA
ncbi:MAG: WhiB family transcriptional regulator [Actinomycetota bacterium]|nr:WhiB family transcriptional regulator [Actinomycetota bacterium]